MKLQSYGSLKYVPYFDPEGNGPNICEVPVTANLAENSMAARARIWIGCESTLPRANDDDDDDGTGVLTLTVYNARRLIEKLTKAVADVVAACPETDIFDPDNDAPA